MFDCRTSDRNIFLLSQGGPLYPFSSNTALFLFYFILLWRLDEKVVSVSLLISIQPVHTQNKGKK